MLRNASSLLATHRGLSALCTAFSTSSPHRLPADSADAATSVTLSSESEPPRRARRRDSDDGQGEAEPYREESRPSRGAQKFRPRDESREDTPRREFRTNVRRPREDRPTREYIPRDRQPREDRPARESFTPRQPREGTSTREFIYRQAREEKPTREFKRYDRGPRQSPTDQEGGRRLLRPPELARRLQALAARGLVDDAAEMLQNAPLDAQNLVVWNTMIKLAMEARKFKLGYSLYTDMKRRGFVPNLRTYSTLLRGYNTNKNWEEHQQQLLNAHKVYDNMVEYIEKAEQQGLDEHTGNHPVAAYMEILGNAKLYQRLFDVYNAWDKDGPLAHNQISYTVMLNALGARDSLPFPGRPVKDQNASDAKLIWRQAVKASEKRGFPIDGHLVRSVITILADGQPSDQLLAFDIVREYLGLVPPGDDPVKAKVPINRHLLFSVLRLCVHAQKYSLCVHYLEQAIENEMEHAIDRYSVDLALRANAALATLGSLHEGAQAARLVEWLHRHYALSGVGKSTHADEVRPRHTTYRLALLACWRGADWESAARIFELVTRQRAADFADGGGGWSTQHLGHLPEFRGDPRLTSLWARTALATGDAAAMRQALRMLARFTPELPRLGSADSMADDQKNAVWEFCQAMLGLVDAVLPPRRRGRKPANAEAAKEGEEGEAAYAPTPEEVDRWVETRVAVKKIIESRPDLGRAPKPEGEELGSLGSMMGMNAVETHIDYQMTQRHMKSTS